MTSSISDKTVPTPAPSSAPSSFEALNLPGPLLKAVRDLGYGQPTPIQSLAIPPALEGRDVLGAAQTGSGKTAAFLLPILKRLLERPRGTTRALILAPTRELAAQIEDSAKALLKHTDLRVASVFGGVGMVPQEKAFKSGVELLVATPGRLLDHFQHPYARLSALEVLVLDEADRMLDMGFLPDIRRVLRHIPRVQQTLFFSATIPAEIAKLSSELLQNPVRVGVERKAAPASGITQTLYPVSEELKVPLLLGLLERGEIKQAIVFTRTKHRANRVAEKLVRAGVNCERIHGNRSQSARTEALAGFKSGKYRILVATDIAARGIDVEDLSHVVNFDVPHVPEDYIHRVGRTARAEATGDALTFVSSAEETDMKAIEKAVGRRIERRVLEGFDYTSRPREQLEVPIAERVAEIRARKSEERARAAAKAQRNGEYKAVQGGRSGGTSASSSTGGHGGHAAQGSAPVRPVPSSSRGGDTGGRPGPMPARGSRGGSRGGGGGRGGPRG